MTRHRPQAHAAKARVIARDAGLPLWQVWLAAGVLGTGALIAAAAHAQDDTATITSHGYTCLLYTSRCV